jgi:hypothetical protein
MMNANNEKIKSLWLTYFSLSEEMLKFIERENIDVFLQLLGQREEVQKILEQQEANDWPRTKEGQALYQKIKPVDMQVQYKARLWLNKSKHKNEVAKAYDSLGEQPAGHVFNREF